MTTFLLRRQATYPVKSGMRKRGLDRIRFEVCICPKKAPGTQREHVHATGRAVCACPSLPAAACEPSASLLRTRISQEVAVSA